MEEKKMRRENDAGGGEDVNYDVASNQNQSSSLIRSFTKPSWLLSALSDLEERMKMTAFKTLPEEDNADTFAHRAEVYYQKRPQLLSLLQDLYHAYLSLADRYCQTLAKQQQHRDRQEDSSEISAFHFEDNHNEETVEDSDAESSLSYQPPLQLLGLKLDDGDHDNIVADLVIKSVDCDILLHELSVMDQRWSETSRKIELQESLLAVLESERMILLNENRRLGYRVSALVEENKGLASESLFMKRKASELARCLLKMRDDRRACMLSRKIEDLQGQIYGLEKRNKEYYEQLVKTDYQARHKHEEGGGGGGGGGKGSDKKSNKKSKREVTLVDCCFYMDEEGVANNSGHVLMKYCGKNANGNGSGGGGRGVYKWWDRVKNFDLFMCGPHPNFTSC